MNIGGPVHRDEALLQVLMGLGKRSSILGFPCTLGDAGRVSFMLSDDLTLLGRPTLQLGYGCYCLGHHDLTVGLRVQVWECLHVGDVEHERHCQIEVPGFVGPQETDQLARHFAFGGREVHPRQQLAVIPQHGPDVHLEGFLVPKDRTQRLDQSKVGAWVHRLTCAGLHRPPPRPATATTQ
ncbi:hypothetical protein ACWCPF_15745 [Streptomyces sp. NPDC001858]